MRLLSPNTLSTITLCLTLAVGCSGGAPTDDATDASGGVGGQASGGQGSGGDGSGGEETDGTGGEETDGSGGESSATGGSGTGGDDGSGGEGSGGDDGSGGEATGGSDGSGGDDGSGGEATGGQGGAGSGGDGSGGDGSGGSSGECTNGDTRPGTTPCGFNLSGTLVQSCEDGVWTDTAVCSGGDECENDDEQTLFDVCGYNDRGDIAQVCVNGVWEGTDCDDPDECEDEAEQTLTDVCGLNDRGDIDQVCVLGLWEGSDCNDPDECEDDDAQVLIDVCGFNDRGDIAQVCVEGVWDGTDCDDPDECEDDQPGTGECLSGSGEQPLFCVEGVWEEDGECTMTGLYRASVSSDGVEGNGASTNPSLSADGRYVAFESAASNLVDDDDNAASDIFVHDVETGETRRITQGSISGQGSFLPSISGDGRYVAFHSQASDLVLNDNNGFRDVFVTDLQTNTTTRVSVTSAEAEVIGVSQQARISADGRYVIFRSSSTQLTPPDTNSSSDAFLRDLTDTTTTRVSVTLTGAQADAYTDWVDISPDGTRLAIYCAATNLLGSNNDTNGLPDVFVRSTTNHTTITRASVSSSEVQSDGWSSTPALSADGRYVAFDSEATNLGSAGSVGYFDVFLRDTSDGTTEIISVSEAGVVGDNYSMMAAISGDGRFVAFQSAASNLVPGDGDALADVFVRDRQAGTVVRFPGGVAAAFVSSNSNSLDLSTDGRFLAYPSDTSTLVDDDDNGVRDVFIAPLE